jgi:hypothetical protein
MSSKKWLDKLELTLHRTKPQSLFAKTASKNVDAAAANGQMFADITPRSEKIVDNKESGAGS